MTKKHFVALADAIRSHRALFGRDEIAILADFCASQNPQFNRERWLAYVDGECGPNGGRVKK